MYMNCRFEILTVYKDFFMFKNECAPSQLMVAYIRPCLLYQGMYRRAYLANILNELGPNCLY